MKLIYQFISLSLAHGKQEEIVYEAKPASLSPTQTLSSCYVEGTYKIVLFMESLTSCQPGKLLYEAWSALENSHNTSHVTGHSPFY